MVSEALRRDCTAFDSHFVLPVPGEAMKQKSSLIANRSQLIAAGLVRPSSAPTDLDGLAERDGRCAIVLYMWSAPQGAAHRPVPPAPGR